MNWQPRTGKAVDGQQAGDTSQRVGHPARRGTTVLMSTNRRRPRTHSMVDSRGSSRWSSRVAVESRGAVM